MTEHPRHALEIDIRIADDAWETVVGIERRIRDTLMAAWDELADTQNEDDATAEVSVLLTGDAEIQCLNVAYRGKNAPTNVLSFPLGDRHDTADFGDGLLGDIVIAYQTVKREADGAETAVEAHTLHMAVHGFLHLLGYDHEKSIQAEEMESLETAILKRLGLPSPYARPVAAE